MYPHRDAARKAAIRAGLSPDTPTRQCDRCLRTHLVTPEPEEIPDE